MITASSLNPDAPLRAIVADDEAPARRRVRALLEGTAVQVVAECATGQETIVAVDRHAPDLLFLDVQMPEGTGFDVVAALPPERRPAIVFVTAYDEFALRAFDVHAVDYLLKPFDRERFAEALDRARASHDAGTMHERLSSLLEQLRELGAVQPPRSYLERIPVRIGPRVRLIAVHDVDCITAEANYVRIHAAGRTYLVRDTMSGLAERLDPALFVRVHRSAIVRIDRVREVEPLFQGEYVLVLESGTKVTSARSYRDRVRVALGLDA